VAFAAILVGATMAMSGLHGLAIFAGLSFVFALVEIGPRAMTPFRRSLALVLPLALFLTVVWIGVVGRSPAEISAGLSGTRAAASLHVARISARLFIVVFAIQSAVACFSDLTPLHFIRGLRIPLTLKRLLVLTLSLIETLRHATDRAHTALIASGLLTRQTSRRNLLNAWVLLQTVWLTGITIVIGRLRDKWPIEGTVNLLDGALAGAEPYVFSRRDCVWLATGVVAGALAFGVD
jgi:hypothetical protein